LSELAGFQGSGGAKSGGVATKVTVTKKIRSNTCSWPALETR